MFSFYFIQIKCSKKALNKDVLSGVCSALCGVLHKMIHKIVNDFYLAIFHFCTIANHCEHLLLHHYVTVDCASTYNMKSSKHGKSFCKFDLSQFHFLLYSVCGAWFLCEMISKFSNESS